MKMEAACRLLDTTDHSVQRVAAALSFEDPLYFSRVFRKVIGCSPQQYRASNLR
jgi:AraC-like DNA-binding protein